MVALSQIISKAALRRQGPALLVGVGHGATHWIIATFYVLLPFLSRDLGLSYAATGALVTLFHGSSLAANLGSGAVVDIAGRRILIQAFSLIVGSGALFAIGWSVGLAGLVIPLILIGLTNNLWHPAAISYLSRTFPDRRGLALAIHTLGATFGDILAPVATGGLLLVMSWRGAASVGALPVLIVAAALLIILKESDGDDARHNGPGALASYFAGLKSLLGNRAMIGLCVMAAFRSMTQNGLLMFLPLYLVAGLDAGPLVLGFGMMLLQVGGIFAGPLAGTLSDRLGRQPVALAGLAATTIVVAALAFVDTIVPFLMLIFVVGFALFSIRPVLHSWAMDVADDSMSGTAISVLFGTQSLFTLAIPVLGGVMADLWGLHTVFYLLTGTVLISTVIAFFLPDAPSGDEAKSP